MLEPAFEANPSRLECEKTTSIFHRLPVMTEPNGVRPIRPGDVPTTPERTPRRTTTAGPESTSLEQALLGTRPPPSVPLGAQSVGGSTLGETLETWTLAGYTHTEGSPRMSATGTPSETGGPERPPPIVSMAPINPPTAASGPGKGSTIRSDAASQLPASCRNRGRLVL